jgi:hypothetical protein
MLSTTTLPILQAVKESNEFYFGLQPGLSGRAGVEYVNRNISFNPASNTLTIGVNLNVSRNALNGNAIAESSLPANKVSPINRLIENAYLIPGSANGNVNIFVGESSVYYLTGNTAGNVTFNLRVSPEVPLDGLLGNGQSITTAFLMTQGNTQFTANLAIDGRFQASSIRWIGNSRPTYASTLTSSQLDVYTFTTIKIGANNYSILGSRTSYGYG